MQFLLFIIFAYLVGSIPFGKLIGKRHGIDIQKKGSGNIGFTNTLRTVGLKPAILVLFADILKGFLPTAIALQLFPLNQSLIIAFTTILAHIFPVWLKFKGGKGVATGIGVVLAINPMIALVPFFVFLIVFLIWRIVSISSIIATESLMLISYFITPDIAIFYASLFILILWTHRENINRLIKGTERRF